MKSNGVYALKSDAALNKVGDEMYALIEELYPICRSITGNGVRQTLDAIREHIPLDIREIPTGTQVFDWIVPKEWNINDAYVKNPDGDKIIDFNASSLHVLNYSVPIREALLLSELRPHLFALPDYPDWIPYKTSYYSEAWGFCLTQKQLDSLAEGQYEVCIDSSLEDGFLTYGEYYLPGETSDEVLLSCHVCHPSLCNDNLSGIALVTFLAEHLGERARRYSYRFLFIPGTIGAITWLALNEDNVQKIKHGLVVACVGDAGNFTYKKSRRGNTDIDRSVMHVLQCSGQPYEILEFSPYGYDERQFCSPGFNLAVGSLTRTPHGKYAEYHTSGDNLEFVKSASLGDSFSKYLAVLGVLEENISYINLNPKCEPRLGKRGLYRQSGGHVETKQSELAMLWVLNLSDGEYSLLDIAERAALPFDVIFSAADRLHQVGLLRQVRASGSTEPRDATVSRRMGLT